MRIEKLSIVAFGSVRQFTLSSDRFQNVPPSKEGHEQIPIAEFLTYVFYGTIPSRLLIPESFLHGIVTVRTDKKQYLRIERKTEIDPLGTPDEDLQIFDIDKQQPLPCVHSFGKAMFGVEASLFQALITLGTEVPIPENLTDICAVLLDADASKNQILHTVRRIDEASSSLLRPNRKGGAIYELEKKRSELQKQIAASTEAAERTHALEKELHRNEEERAKAEADLRKLLELQNAYGNLSVIREFDRLHTIENELDTARSAYEKFLSEHRVGDFLPTEDYCEEISELQTQVTTAVRTYTETRTALDSLEIEEPDAKTLAHLHTVEKKYNGSHVVRHTADLLFRRASHTAVFICLALFAAAFFTVLTILASVQNVGFFFSFLLLTFCCVASALVLFFSRHRFANALLILCREFDTKNRGELFARLQFLENEKARFEERQEKIDLAKQNFENAKRICIEVLEKLNQATAKWGHRIDPTNAPQNFDSLLCDVQAFLQASRDFKADIAKKERNVALGRKELSHQSEIAVRALVSPIKRENLRQLERENRLPEISRGIDFYNRQIEEIDLRIADLRTEHAQSSSHIDIPHELYRERDRLTERINTLRSMYSCYLLFKQLLLLKTEKEQKDRSSHLYMHYQKKLCKNEEADKDTSLAAYFALCVLLFREKPPFVLHTDALSSETFDALRTVCQEEKRQMFTVEANASYLLNSLS